MRPKLEAMVLESLCATSEMISPPVKLMADEHERKGSNAYRVEDGLLIFRLLKSGDS
jgi:hypothetical protein